MTTNVSSGVFVLGSNHRNCPVELRERLAFSKQEIPSALQRLCRDSGLEETVMLSTCNRLEIYGASLSDSREIQSRLFPFLQKEKQVHLEGGEHFYVHLGRDAAAHLFRVAASLDSMVLGENQILGQVREAYQLGVEARTVGRRLHSLFPRAVLAGRRVRAQTRIGVGAVSIASVAVDLAKKIFSKLAEKKLLLVGAGEMAELCLEHLNAQGVGEIAVVNRSLDRASIFAELYGARACSIESLQEELSRADIAIVAVSAEKHLIDLKMVKQLRRSQPRSPLFLIDLSIPRCVEPAIHRLENTFLYNIDDLQQAVKENQSLRQGELERSLVIVEKELQRLDSMPARARTGPVLSELQSKLQKIREEEELQLIQRLKGRLDPESIEAIRQSFRRMMNRVFYPPAKTIKAQVEREHGEKLLDLTRELFRLEEPERPEE